MTTRRRFEICTVLSAILIASVASIPVDTRESSEVTETVESREEMMTRYRLPNNTIPRLYKLSIEPNMEDDNFTWTGEASIDIEVLRATTIVTLHAYKSLIIDENFTVLVDANGTNLKPIGQNRDDEVEFFKITFDREITIGNYSLNFKYEGADSNDLFGFYKVPLPNSTIAGTQLPPTSARRVFPCWDEPGFKARFRTSIKHFPNYTAIANMPEIESVPTADGKVLTTFDTTPIMSTYLLTFVIADFESVTNEHGNVTLWARKELLEEVKHAVKLSPKVVDVMENYTGFSFGLPRIGSVLMPYFMSSATEHWGLIGYAEHSIRFNRTTDPRSTEDTANLVIAHELAHSWFGNRVTHRWWNDVWLSEAFATYFSYYIVDEIFDNWGGEELFVLQTKQIAFKAEVTDDISVTWTPITNMEILQMFGPITYKKGAAIVHMFRNVLTDKVFRAGIRKFMAEHSFDSAMTNDLTRSLQEAHDEAIGAETPLNVEETMTPWLTQSGYPIVNVTRNYTTGVTKVSQQSHRSGKNSLNKWSIPLTYTTQTDLNFSSALPLVWISDKEDNVSIDGIAKDDWVIFNVRSSGYYRVDYDDVNWNRILDYLNTEKFKNIHSLNRAQLINDAHYMMERDPERYYKIAHKIGKYLSREDDYLPWSATKDAVFGYEKLLRGTEVHETFERYILGLMKSLIEKVGFEARDDDDHLTILSRADFVGWACSHGHSGCSDYAGEKLLKVIENGTNHRLHGNTKSSIFCAGLRVLNDTSAKRVVAWALENDVELLTENLGCTENHEIQKEFLNSAIAKNSTTSAREVKSVFGTIVAGNEENFNFAVDFLLQNHEAMKNLVTSNESDELLNEALVEIVYQVKTASRLEKFKQVLKLDAVGGSESYRHYAESRLADSDEVVAKFRNFWSQQLSADNNANDSHTDSP